MIDEKGSAYNFDSLHGCLSRSELIAERIEYEVTFRLYSNRLFHVSIPKDMKIGKSVIDSSYQFLEDNGGGKFFNLHEFDSFSDVEPEVRDWAADSSGNLHTFCDAIIIRNLGQKNLADFYLKVNKPKMPTKIFYSVDKALEWIKKQKYFRIKQNAFHLNSL
jgi:hypothetical protein